MYALVPVRPVDQWSLCSLQSLQTEAQPHRCDRVGGGQDFQASARNCWSLPRMAASQDPLEELFKKLDGQVKNGQRKKALKTVEEGEFSATVACCAVFEP